MKEASLRVEKLARLLEIAARKQNASAEATCSIASYLGDEFFDAIFGTVSELARVSTEKRPDFRRAARELISKARRSERKARNYDGYAGENTAVS